MERYHSDQHFDFGKLFDVYEMALKIAKDAKNTALISHYEKRISEVSSVHFNKK